MAKSPNEFRQSAAKKAQKQASWNNTDYTTTPNTSASELAAEKAKVHALENKHTALSSELAAKKAKAQALENKHTALSSELAAEKAKTQTLENKHNALSSELAAEKAKTQTLEKQKESLEGKHIDLNKTHANLKVEHENLKTNCLSDDKDTTGTTEDSSSDNKDKEDGGKLEFPNKIGYNLIAPIIEKIKAEFFLSDDKGDEVKKCHATSISYKKSNDKCFEIDDHNLKSTESDNCEKIYSLHTFLDSIGMDKDNTNHAEFLGFMSDSTELKEGLAANLHDFIKQYSYSAQEKLLKHVAGQECLKVENGRISTYGENSFSDECAPLINLYMLLQIANDKEIWHYNNYDLKDYDDTEFQNILAFDCTDPSAAAAYQ
jgi:hypothetical protein